MSPTVELERRLASLGLNVRAETFDRHLLLVPTSDDTNLADEALRTAVIAVAREAGFTHVSVELVVPACASSSP